MEHLFVWKHMDQVGHDHYDVMGGSKWNIYLYGNIHVFVHYDVMGALNGTLFCMETYMFLCIMM